jgi:hypothetical protein
LTGLLIFSCQREHDGYRGKLVSFRDSDNLYRLEYNGNRVTEIHVDSGVGAPYLLSSYTYAADYVKASLHPSSGYSYVEYFLKNSVFPLTIKKYKNFSGKDSLVNRVDFYYRPGGMALDSVILQNSMHLKFIPVYNGSNISDYLVSQNGGPAILSGSFLYYPLANIFKTTNPLLFIYSKPVFDFEVFMLPRIYSAETLKKFNGGTFNYGTDAKGNLALEDYGPSVFPFRRTYTYK